MSVMPVQRACVQDRKHSSRLVTLCEVSARLYHNMSALVCPACQLYRVLRRILQQLCIRRWKQQSGWPSAAHCWGSSGAAYACSWPVAVARQQFNMLDQHVQCNTAVRLVSYPIVRQSELLGIGVQNPTIGGQPLHKVLLSSTTSVYYHIYS